MNFSYRAILRDIAIYGGGDMLLKASSIVTIPIYTRIFTVQEYGMWSFITAATGMLNGILALGGDSAYARLYFEAKTIPERQALTSTWLAFLSVWAISVACLFLPFSEVLSEKSFGNPGHSTLFMLALCATPVSLVNTMCGQVLRNGFRAWTFSVLNGASVVLSICLGLYVAVYLQLGLAGILWGALLAGVILLPIRVWSIREMLRPVFSSQLLRSLLQIGTPLVPMSVAYWVFSSSDRIVLGRLSTLEQLGLYSIAASLVTVLGLANSAVGQAWSPYAVSLYEERPQDCAKLYGQMMTYLLAGFGFLSVCLTAFAPEVLLILTTSQYYGAAAAVGPLCLGAVALGSTNVTALGISLAKRTQYFAVVAWLAAFLNVALNFLLVPLWGMLGSSWATAVSFIFLTLAYCRISQRFSPVAYHTQPIAVVVGLTLFFVLAVPMLPNLGLLASLMIKGFYCFLYGGLVWAMGSLGNPTHHIVLPILHRKPITERRKERFP